MEKLKFTLVTLVLLFFVTLSCYFFYKVIFAKSITSTENTVNPDVFIENLNSLNFDKNGNVEMNLMTPLMQYNSYSKNAVLNTPHIIVYQTDSAPWIITADNGNVLKNFSIFKLIGNVKLNQGPTAKTQGTIITTSELTLHLNSHIATTKQNITFTQVNTDHSHITVNAKGAMANQKTGEIKLFSNTQGVYNAK